MYNQGIAVSILVNGVPQAELSGAGIVALPHNTPYAIRIRNRNNFRGKVTIEIDGEQISGTFVLDEKAFIDIQRPADRDTQFVFVSADSPEATDFGKNSPHYTGKRGIVTVKFYPEAPAQVRLWSAVPAQQFQPWTYYNLMTGGWAGDGEMIGGLNHRRVTSTPAHGVNFTCVNASVNLSSNLQEGCTVEGGVTNQNFIQVAGFPTAHTPIVLTVKLVCKNEKAEELAGKEAELNQLKTKLKVLTEIEELKAKIKKLEGSLS